MINRKALFMALTCTMVLGATTTAFAAENTGDSVLSSYEALECSDESNATVEDGMTFIIPANGETSDIITLSNSSPEISPFKNGEKVSFRLGETGYMSNCGFNPKFRFRASGGSADTLIKFHITTAGGTAYSQGNIKANNSQYMDKQYVVVNGKGTWSFTASIVSGPNSGNITCSVEQIY